jgi:C-terminal processing protease CtpA/Prc
MGIPPPPAAVTKPEFAPTPLAKIEDIDEWGAFVREGFVLLRTTIIRGQHGIGIDLGKNRAKEAVVQKLKEMPDGSANPALICQPSLERGDRIIGVNGTTCELFEDVVTAIKGGLATSRTLHFIILRQT